MQVLSHKKDGGGGTACAVTYTWGDITIKSVKKFNK